MLLEFTQAFGNFKPGDLIEIEDDAAFDGSYLREAPPGAVKAPKPAPQETGSAEPPLYPRKGK